MQIASFTNEYRDLVLDSARGERGRFMSCMFLGSGQGIMELNNVQRE